MAEYDALVTLAGRPGHTLRMAELAADILQPRSSLTRIVGSLEERGLVGRGPATGDGRGIAARLTPAPGLVAPTPARQPRPREAAAEAGGVGDAMPVEDVTRRTSCRGGPGPG